MILGLSPDRSLTGFFRFSIWRRENGAEWQGSSGKGGRCSIFRTEEYFYYHRASNDGSVLSQSLTILCSVAGISHSRGRYFLIRGCWGCAARWGRIFTSGLTIMESHFHWSFTKMESHIFGFLG